MEERNKQKRGGSGVVDIIKMTWNVGSVNKIESRREAERWCEKLEQKLRFCCVLDAAKVIWCNGFEASRLDYYTRRGLRSSKPLRVVAILTVAIQTSCCH